MVNDVLQTISWIHIFVFLRQLVPGNLTKNDGCLLVKLLHDSLVKRQRMPDLE